MRHVVNTSTRHTGRFDILASNFATDMFRSDVSLSTADNAHFLDCHFALNNVSHVIRGQGLLLMKKTVLHIDTHVVIIMASNLPRSALSKVRFADVTSQRSETRLLRVETESGKEKGSNQSAQR